MNVLVSKGIYSRNKTFTERSYIFKPGCLVYVVAISEILRRYLRLVIAFTVRI